MITTLGSINPGLHHVLELPIGLTGVAQAQLKLVFGQINL